MTVNPFITCAACCITCLLSISTPVNGQVDQIGAANDPLEEFLVQNGLTRLLITHREVRAENALDDRDQRIEQLQQSYARELFGRFADEAWEKNLLAKAKSFLVAHPNRQSERLRLAVSHRTVELFQRQHLTGFEIAQTDIDRTIEEINLIQRGVKLQIDNLDRLAELKQTEIGDRGFLDRLRQQFRHGEYLLGWSHFLKSAASNQHSKPVLRDAESYFRSFLELDPHANLTKFSADRFGRRSRFQKLATAGLGAVLHSLGADQQSNHCFQIALANSIVGSNAESELEIIRRWKFASYLNDNRVQAAKMLEQNPALLGDEMLIEAILKRSASADEIVEKGLAGLALMRDAARLREAMNAFPDAFAERPDNPLVTVMGHWIRGYLLLYDFQNTGEEVALKRATAELSDAVKQLRPQIPAEIRGHCRFLFGTCLHLNKAYPSAAREFLRAAQSLRSSEMSGATEQDLAAESAYRALQSVRLIAGDQKSSIKSITTSLNANFSETAFAKLANFDADLDRRDSLPDKDAVAYLNSFRENEPSVLVRSTASVELARRYSRSADFPIAQFSNYLKTIQNDGRVSDSARIETNYYYISKLLSQPNPSRFEKEIEDVLADAQRRIEGASPTNLPLPQTAKLLYFQALTLKTLQPNNYRVADGYFQQIKQLNFSSTWKMAATLEIAKIFENAEEEAKIDDQSFRSKMVSVYEFLSRLPTSTPPTNREVVSLKLARMYITDGRLSEAEALITGAKQDAMWLPIRANLAEKKNDLRQSASLWQQLEKQSSTGTALWLDARLRRLLVLYQFDKPAATEILARTIALNPNMPSTYATQFQQIADQWGNR